MYIVVIVYLRQVDVHCRAESDILRLQYIVNVLVYFLS